MKREMRRKDRETGGDRARELLEGGEFGILSTVGSDGTPYGIPMSYCVIGDTLYFHCAVKGHKLDNMNWEPRVSFCVVGKTRVLPEQFATRYESVIVAGRAEEVFEREKQRALEGFQEKYSPDFRTEGLAYIAQAWDKTRVFKVAIESLSGKARQ